MNPQLLFANNAASTLAGPITNVATTLNLASGGGALFPSPAAGQAFKLTLTDVATGLIQEIMLCTSRTGDVLTVMRGQEGTSALPWNTGDFVDNLNTAGAAGQFSQLNQPQAAVVLSNANHVLTAPEYAAKSIAITGALTADCAVVFPDNFTGLWVITNLSTGAHAVTAKTASGTGVTVSQDSLPIVVVSDGTNIGTLGYITSDSPAMIGTPTVPTAAPGTNTTQAASTGFVHAAVAGVSHIPNITFLNAGSGTYTPPAGTVLLHVRMAAAGGGGGRAAGGNGSDGSAHSTFGTQFDCAPGKGGVGGNDGIGGAVGVVTVTGLTNGVALSSGAVGGGYGAYSSTTGNCGGNGGGNGFGPGAPGVNSNGVAGANNATTPGAGGGGAGIDGVCAGGGGGAGAYVEFWLTSAIAGSYAWANGTGGAGATGATQNGGNGKDGFILIEAYTA